MDSLKLNSKTEITNVYNIVIQDVIKNIKDVFKDENISQYVLRDLETLWTTKFLKTREPTLPVTLVPMKIMVPFKKSPSTEITEIREIELMVPHHEAELLDFSTIFSDGIMNSVVNLTNRAATTFLQQRINTFLVSKDQVENMIFVNEEQPEILGQDPDDRNSDLGQDPLDDEITESLDDEITESLDDEITEPLDDVKTEPLDDINEDSFGEVPIGDASIKEEPTDTLDDFVVVKEETPQTDGANDSSDDDSSDDSKTSTSEKSEEEVDQSIYGSDGETLNSEDDVTDEDIETLFDCDNLILCQYMKVMRCKNKWRFYFKDGVMNLNGCDYAFHKIFGDASW